MADRGRIFIFAAATYLMLSATLAPAAAVEVGVKAGDWAQYRDITTSWTTSLQNRTEPLTISELRNTDWIRFEVQGVSETFVQGLLIFHFKDGSPDMSASAMGDLGNGNLGIYLIAAGLSKGERFNISGAMFTILESPLRVCGGEDRDVNYLQVKETMPVLFDTQNFTQVSAIDIYWDRAEGILCEFLAHETLNHPDNGKVEEASTSLKLTETSLWGPGAEAEAEAEAKSSTTLGQGAASRDLTPNILVGVAVVGVLVGVFIYKRMRRKPEVDEGVVRSEAS